MIKLSIAGGGALLLAGCAAPPPASWLVAPADPAIAVPRLREPAVTAGIRRFRVVEPKDWRELNRAVAPRPAAPRPAGPSPVGPSPVGPGETR